MIDLLDNWKQVEFLAERVIIFYVKPKYVFVAILSFLLIAIGLVAAAWFKRPLLIKTSPSEGAISIPITAQVRMEFSRPMDYKSVTSRLVFEPPLDGSYREEGKSLVFIPAKPMPGGEDIKVSLSAGARAASWLAFPMQGISWTFKTSDLTLAYLWPSDGPADIYALNPTTGGVTQYTHGMDVQEFSASSDGLVLYFSGNNSLGGTDIYQIDRKVFADLSSGTSHQQTLVECGASQCRSPVASPDGRYLAYELIQAVTGDETGTASVQLVSMPGLSPTPLGDAKEETVQPSWSSRGWLAYYNRSSEVYELYDPVTSTHVLLTNQTGQPGSWSPDGNFYLAPEIYYYPANRTSETGTSHLLKYAVSNGIWTDLSVEIDVEDVEGSYSPDGGMIAFARKYLGEARWSFGRQLWVMHEDGSSPSQVTNEADFNHYDLAWSRDSRKLAYVRFDQVKLSDPPELWMINADGSNALQLVIGGYSPIWIP